MMIMITILAVTKMVVVVAKSVMAKCEKCVFLKLNNLQNLFFLILKMNVKVFRK